ncbi:MAG: FliA/WhiG family RNA polymerase sigma factor [Gammaproteobacteria bacterium TMED50]|nr:MAG: FliA/WhiG family RNA polymerase sigma factor [Gammaproteobacteria bacterium TMED50]
MSKDSDASQPSKGVPRDYKTASPYSSRPSQGITPELLSLVKRTALHLKGRLPKNVEVDDLMQSGLEGLIQAMDSFDESRNITLEQYSKTRIRGAMLDDVRRMSQTTRTTIGFKREHRAAVEKLTIRFGREPTGREVASYLGKDIDTYQKERVIIAGSDNPSDDTAITTSLESDDIEPSPHEDLEKRELISNLKDSINELPERTQLILSLYYQDELSLKEIAAVIDVSESRVSQILSDTANRLRTKLSINQ